MTNQIRYVNGGYNKRSEWKDINIFKTKGKVKIPSRGKGKVSDSDRTFSLDWDYEAQWEEFVIQNNYFYLFWNEIVL